MKITLLIDNQKSWMMSYISHLGEYLKKNHSVMICHNANDIKKGDIAFFLSCEKLVSEEIRSRNTHNIVIHASDLPKGKGWSPTTWQILEDKRTVPITLFEAIDGVDAGEIYFKDFIKLNGTELLDEWHKKLGEKVNEMAIKFVDDYLSIKPKPQKGNETFYKRRKTADSEIDIKKTIKEQFNLLRVVDNEQYPAFFYHKGEKYILKIYKDKNSK